MGVATKIQWCDHTFNPWRGCSKVSAGCQNCYAEKQAKRNPNVLGIWGDKGKRVIASERAWNEVLKWNAAAAKVGEIRRVFCGSMCDIFEDRPELDEPRRRVARLVWETQNLQWLFLTKRPENAKAMSYIMWFDDAEWPKNYAIGTSIENQDTANERRRYLLRCPAPMRFLSAEPLLGPIDFRQVRTHEGDKDVLFVGDEGGWEYAGSRRGFIDWVIVGGESGPKARACNVEWIRDIVRQCKEAGAACFVKQLGAHVIDYGTTSATHFEPEQCWPDGTQTNHHRVLLKDSKGGDIGEFPDDLKVREFPR